MLLPKQVSFVFILSCLGHYLSHQSSLRKSASSGIDLWNIVYRRVLIADHFLLLLFCLLVFDSGIATSVAIAMYQNSAQERSQALAVPILYGVLEAVVICLYCLGAWKAGWTKAPPDEALCNVISNSYEGGREQQHPAVHHYPHADEDEIIMNDFIGNNNDLHLTRWSSASSSTSITEKSVDSSISSVVNPYSPVSVDVGLEVQSQQQQQQQQQLSPKHINDLPLSPAGVIISSSGILLQDCSSNLAKRFVSERDDAMVDPMQVVESVL